jgi:ribosome biogenesis GTPase
MGVLADFGWDESRRPQLEEPALAGCGPARVIEKHLRAFTLITEDGEREGHCLRGIIDEGMGFPALGDWVAAEPETPDGKRLIRRILPRRGAFTRKRAGDELAEHVIAANVDFVFIVAGLGEEYNPRRLERYLAAAYSFGAAPVILLNKTDLRADWKSELGEASGLAAGVPVHPVSAQSGAGLEALAAYWGPGRTAAFVGSSGVGKSSLINRLLGREAQKTASVRAVDDKGKHTTVSGRLILLPGGGVLVDTAGMRELQLWDSSEGLETVFSEIEAAAEHCKFRDCAHEAEPGCAVRAALEAGKIEAQRLDSWRKLRRELDYMAAKEDKVLESQKKKKWKEMSRALRRRIEDKRR